MRNLPQIEQLPCKVEYLPHDMCSITFTVHQADITAFQMMLGSLNILFRNLAFKAKTNIHAVHDRILKNQGKSEQYIEDYEKCVCQKFKEYCDVTTPRESLQLTVPSVKELYPNTSLDQIKHILIKHKLLKKTGFYKQKTH